MRISKKEERIKMFKLPVIKTVSSFKQGIIELSVLKKRRRKKRGGEAGIHLSPYTPSKIYLELCSNLRGTKSNSIPSSLLLRSRLSVIPKSSCGTQEYTREDVLNVLCHSCFQMGK